MLSVIVHGGGVKIILILQIDSCKTNCSLCCSNWFNHFSSLWKFQGRVLTNTHTKGNAISQEWIRGTACAWPTPGVQNLVSHKEPSVFPRKAGNTEGDGKGCKTALFITNSNRYGIGNIQISLRCFHASTAVRGECIHSTFCFHKVRLESSITSNNLLIPFANRMTPWHSKQFSIGK